MWPQAEADRRNNPLGAEDGRCRCLKTSFVTLALRTECRDPSSAGPSLCEGPALPQDDSVKFIAWPSRNPRARAPAPHWRVGGQESPPCPLSCRLFLNREKTCQ